MKVALCYKRKEGVNVINTNKLKGRLAELGLTQKDVADYLGLANATVSQKINNIRPMTLNEALKLSELLEIDDCHFRDYFFASTVA